ncbi:MAG: GNAT family N-acetyltransferase [Sphingomonas sp.]
MTHPLDRPVWNAFTTRQRRFATGDAHAIRVDPAVGLFAAMADDTPDCRAALAKLLPAEGVVGLVERTVPALPAEACVVKTAECVQMVADHVTVPLPDFAWRPLGAEDAAEMLALATLTEPGPFFARTHVLGGFVGVHVDGALVAMAGRRMQPPGFTEVSAVCTRPGFRGRGYAAGLMAVVAAGIAERGERPFLHAYADRPATIALYERLGFRVRATMQLTLVARA